MDNNSLISNFMGKLKNAQPPERSSDGESKDYLQTMNLGRRDWQGKLITIPFLGEEGAFVFMNYSDHADNRVMEVSMYLEGQDNEAWIKILPKEFIGTLSPEDEQLYEKVRSKFKTIRDAEWLDDSWLRLKSYGLMYGYVLQHNNMENKSMIGVEGGSRTGASLIILPSATVSKSFDGAVESTTLQAGGSHEWLPQFYNNNATGRIGFLTTTFYLSTTSIGYTVAFEHGTNSALFKVIPDDLVIPDSELAKFGSLLRDFLGHRQRPETGLFNRKVFLQIDAYLDRIIAAKGDPYASPAQQAINLAAQASIDESKTLPTQAATPEATPVQTESAFDGMAATPQPVGEVAPMATTPPPIQPESGQINQGFAAPPPVGNPPVSGQ